MVLIYILITELIIIKQRRERKREMAEALNNKLGTSLPVPLVQELAKETLDKVPERYVRPDQDPPIISDANHSLLQVPVIDMSNLFSQESGQSELEKLHLACKDWGFFQVYIYYRY